MADLRGRISNIAALARALDSDYSHLHGVLKGAIRPSVDLAQLIESATHGAIRAWELLGLNEGPAPIVPETPRDAA